MLDIYFREVYALGTYSHTKYLSVTDLMVCILGEVRSELWTPNFFLHQMNLRESNFNFENSCSQMNNAS